MTKCMVYIPELKMNTNNETEAKEQLIKPHRLIF